MAEVTLTPQEVDKDGVEPSYTALNATDTYKFQNGADTLLHFKNTGGSEATVTVVTPGTVAGQAITDKDLSVPAGEERMMAALPTSLFNDTSGEAEFSQDQASGVSVAIVRLS